MKSILLAPLSAATLLLAACSGGGSTPGPTVTVTATPGSAESSPAAPPPEEDGTYSFGQPGGETFPGLTISFGKPRAATNLNPNNSTVDSSSDRVFVIQQTYTNTTGAVLTAGSGGTEAAAGPSQKVCAQVFATKPDLGANSTGPIPPNGKKTYLVGFACDAKKGDSLTVSAWAQGKGTGNPIYVTYVGTMP